MNTRAKKAPPPHAFSPDAIARAITEIYRGPAWHGPSVRSTLKGVTAAQAGWRPAPGRNSIDDLVLHLTYTRHRMLGRLATVQGNKRSRFPRAMRLSWFPHASDPLDEEAWTEDLRLLEEYQDRVLASLRDVEPATLSLCRPGKGRTVGAELMGIAFHDAYHAGQIRLLALVAPEEG